MKIFHTFAGVFTVAFGQVHVWWDITEHTKLNFCRFTEDDFAVVLPRLCVNNVGTAIKFLGLLLNENITSKDHIRIIKNKLAERSLCYIELNTNLIESA